MKISTAARAGAVVSSMALLSLSTSPALAAEPVARAAATGLVVTAEGRTQGTEPYSVTHDGTTETATGSRNPSLSALTGQDAVTFGTVAQDARTTVVDGDGRSVACAGAAGNGATVVGVGDAATCLTGGEAVDLSAGTLDLSGLTLVDNPALAPLDGPLRAALDPVAAQLDTATTQLLAALGDPAVTITLGAVQSSCTSDPTSASGTATLAGAGVTVRLPAVGGQAAQDVRIATLPVDPAPNTRIVTDLDQVATEILDALRQSLTTTATGALAPLEPVVGGISGTPLDQVQAQLVEGVLGQVAPQLQPLEDNLLSGTLNKQERPTANSIVVTALDLDVLPVADALSLEVGRSSCGPNGRVAAPAAPAPEPPALDPPARQERPAVPTSVPAGYETAPLANAPLGPVALSGLGGLLVLSIATGAAVHRRRARG